MDSATCLALARAEGWETHALAFDYGQRHRAELQAARRVAVTLGAASFRVIRLGFDPPLASALTGGARIPKDRPREEIGRGIPPTYVPARNMTFLSLALGVAESIDADAVVIGVNALDSSGYPDCRPPFLEAFREASRRGTRRGAEGRPVEILAPLLSMTKGEIVARGVALRVPFEVTLSCYDPTVVGSEARHCRRCDACLLRARGFAEAGRTDPAP
jgi:7-cyano-7-deazaguanine synthase